MQCKHPGKGTERVPVSFPCLGCRDCARILMIGSLLGALSVENLFVCLFSFFLSWVANTQFNHWAKAER